MGLIDNYLMLPCACGVSSSVLACSVGAATFPMQCLLPMCPSPLAGTLRNGGFVRAWCSMQKKPNILVHSVCLRPIV